MSASALAEFIIAPPDRQDSLLHDQRYSSAYVTPKHQQALSVIRSFCADNARDWGAFDQGRDALVQKSVGAGFTPSQQDEAARCVEKLDLFRAHAQNAFGVMGSHFTIERPFEGLTISGLPISVYPDLVHGSWPVQDGKKIGLVFIRAQKRPDPSAVKTDAKRVERAEYRREVLAYMMVLGDMMLRSNGVPDQAIDRKRFAGWDLRTGEEVTFPSDRVSREKRIEAAAGQIARLWETIAPKPGDLA